MGGMSDYREITHRFTFTVLFVLEILAMAFIATADYHLGHDAQLLNGYEIIRRTFLEPLGIHLPVVSDVYVIGQSAAGQLALAWAWLLYLLWALVFAFPTFMLFIWLWRQ